MAEVSNKITIASNAGIKNNLRSGGNDVYRIQYKGKKSDGSNMTTHETVWKKRPSALEIARRLYTNYAQFIMGAYGNGSASLTAEITGSKGYKVKNRGEGGKSGASHQGTNAFGSWLKSGGDNHSDNHWETWNFDVPNINKFDKLYSDGHAKNTIVTWQYGSTGPTNIDQREHTVNGSTSNNSSRHGSLGVDVCDLETRTLNMPLHQIYEVKAYLKSRTGHNPEYSHCMLLSGVWNVTHLGDVSYGLDKVGIEVGTAGGGLQVTMQPAEIVIFGQRGDNDNAGWNVNTAWSVESGDKNSRDNNEGIKRVFSRHGWFKARAGTYLFVNTADTPQKLQLPHLGYNQATGARGWDGYRGRAYKLTYAPEADQYY